MLVLEGMPLLLLELGIGQRLRAGSLGVWNMIHPWLGGIGLGSAVVAIVVGCYYNVIIAWCLYYLMNSFRGTLPWSECPALTNTVGSNVSEANVSLASTDLLTECEKSSETQFFWYRQTLDISSSIAEPDGIRWWMFLCLLASWIMIYLIIMKGIESSGKIVYFTALFPYVVMTIFFIRGITLKGASAGLAHMFNPKMEFLLKPTVWMDAANQVFYSYGLAFGSMISFGSYNPPNKNCVKDVLYLSLCNASTAVYACAVIFAILGFKAQHLFDKCMERDVSLIMESTDMWLGKNVSDITAEEYNGLMVSHVFNDTTLHGTLMNNLKNCSLAKELDQAAQGTGLAFIVMADVFTKLPGAPFWSILFFSMLLSLGIGSQIGILEGFISTLFDMPRFKHVSKPVLSAVACAFCMTIGLIFTTGAGEYFLTLFDTYGAMGLTLIALTEIIAVMYVYGHAQFTDDIEEMTGIRPGFYWQICWRFIAPALLSLVLVASVITQAIKTPTYVAWNAHKAEAENKEYPPFAIGLAFILALASVVPIIVVAVLRMLKISTPDPTDYKTQMSRVSTNASTLPMFSNEYQDNPDNTSQHSSDSDRGLQCDGSSIEDSSARKDASSNPKMIFKVPGNDRGGIDEINTVSHENVVNLIET